MSTRSVPPDDHVSTALVMEGGGLRGAFGAGVLDELARQGTPAFDDLVAVSSGSPTAIYYATGQAAAGTRIWRHHTHSAQLIAARNLLAGRPIMDIDRLVRVFQHTVQLDHAALAACPSRVWIGLTDCTTGSPRYVRATPANVFELLRAAMALPVANGRVVPVEGRPAIDGGVAAPIPLRHALSLHPERTLVVLTRPRGYRRHPSPLTSALIGWTYPRHAAVRVAMTQLAQVANDALDEVERLEATGAIDVIRPAAPLAAGRLSRHQADIDATIASGVAAAQRWLAGQTWW